MDNILAIFDSEKNYIKKLTAFFESRTTMPFSVLAFDNPEKLTRYFSENKASVLLVHKKKWQPSIKNLANQIILLVEEKEEECLKSDFTENEMPAVCKYQSGEAIAKKVLGICAVAKASLLPEYQIECANSTRAEIIGIYTPVGRSLQTSFAITYSRLRANAQKTLYLNFEVFSGFGAWFERNYETDLMDLMYFLDGPTDKFLLKLAGMSEKFGGLDYIPPAISYEDFMMVTAKEWIKLIQTIAERSNYEVIVLDLGSQIQGLFDILSLCKKIYTITKPDGIAMAKINAYEEALQASQKEGVLHKTVKCSLPVFQRIPQKAAALGCSQLAEYMKKELDEVFS